MGGLAVRGEAEQLIMDHPLVRALMVPLALVVVFFSVARTCTKVMARDRAAETVAAQQAAAPRAAAAAPTQPAGLQFPEGLEEERIGYLVSIDSEFTAPATAVVSKQGYDSYASTLQGLGYMSRQEDGTYVLSREGLLNLSVQTEDPKSWTILLAKRVFDKVTDVDDMNNGTYCVTVSWHWDATSVGARSGIRNSLHAAVADFSGGAGHWALNWTSSLDTR